MKMVKSLLLGSAAGLVAVTAGQAAELPVKAKPVEYVKICTLYGAGFYYMPGTDMCIKIGGWTRAEVTDKANGNFSTGPFANNSNSRATNNLTVRARGYITADAREQTEFGVARAYIDVGLSTNTVGLDNASNTFSSNRAFVQWAGFTAGLSRSFFDFYNAAVQNYRAGFFPQEDTGDAGWWVWAYTAQLGGGLSATISAEERRMNQIINDAGAVAAASSLAAFSRGSGFGGWQAPDIVGNIRIDQAWGSAQIMAAGHQLNPLYYGTLESSGGPGTDWGWVVGAGAHLNLPFIWQGDYIEGEVNYTQGAVTYLANSTGITQANAQGGKQSWGLSADCVYGSSGVGATSLLPALNGTGCEQTSAWSAILSYEHYWTPQWHQSFTGGYMQFRYDDAANNMLCALEGQSARGSGHGAAAVAAAGCDNDWNYWVVGSRLQWDVTKSFYLGVEALYLNQDSASSATGLVPLPVAIGAPTLCAVAGGGCRSSDNHEWVFTLRMHKDFLP